jgi:protein-tyrosine phosphatase
MAVSRVLIVCSGNICRSPMAEVVLRSLDPRLVVDSAGTGSWHEGEGMDVRAIDALRSRGYDGTDHRARQVAPRWLAQRDLVLAADRGHLRHLQHLATNVAGAAPLRLLGEFAANNLSGGSFEVPDIPDPYYKGPAEFAACLELIERCCRGLLGATGVSTRQ